MRRGFAELRGRKELLDDYRAFRRGVITLPHLERGLQQDLEILDRCVESHRSSPMLEGFLEVAILMMGTTKDVVGTTLEASEALIDYVSTSGAVMEASAHASYVTANIRDEQAKQLILNTLKVHGGLQQLLGTSHDFLAAKQHAYSRALRLAKQRTEESWGGARLILTDHYKGELETLIDYWKRRLKEEKEALGGQVYFSEVEYELCQRYPAIAAELGIECDKQHGMWPIILIAVACAILCEGG